MVCIDLTEFLPKDPVIPTRDAHFPGFQFPVGKREILPISRSGKTGKSGKIDIPKMSKNN